MWQKKLHKMVVNQSKLSKTANMLPIEFRSIKGKIILLVVRNSNSRTAVRLLDSSFSHNKWDQSN